ncbi:unnamed protein product, partial [Urochloa humidicola]
LFNPRPKEISRSPFSSFPPSPSPAAALARCTLDRVAMAAAACVGGRPDHTSSARQPRRPSSQWVRPRRTPSHGFLPKNPKIPRRKRRMRHRLMAKARPVKGDRSLSLDRSATTFSGKHAELLAVGSSNPDLAGPMVAAADLEGWARLHAEMEPLRCPPMPAPPPSDKIPPP